MKSALLSVFFLFNYCFHQQYEHIRTTLIDSFGKEWYDKFSADSTHGFYFTVAVDSSGKVVEIKKHGIGAGITKDELLIFFAALQKKPFPCIYHGDPHISLQEYFKFGNGKVDQSFTFWPLTMNAFLDKKN